MVQRALGREWGEETSVRWNLVRRTGVRDRLYVVSLLVCPSGNSHLNGDRFELFLLDLHIHELCTFIVIAVAHMTCLGGSGLLIQISRGRRLLVRIGQRD